MRIGYMVIELILFAPQSPQRQTRGPRSILQKFQSALHEL